MYERIFFNSVKFTVCYSLDSGQSFVLKCN